MCSFADFIDIATGTHFTYSNFGFLNGLKLELVAFSVFGNNRKNGLFVNKDDCMFGLQF